VLMCGSYVGWVAVQLATATPVPTLRIFISSGDDAAALRERVAGLIEKAVNSQLTQLGIDLQLKVDRWEDTAADTNDAGETTNERFVKRALTSDLTLALLVQKLGPGTREEIEATLEAGKELKVLWFVPKRSRPRSQVARFLEPLGERIYYDKTGLPEDDESWHGIVRVLLQIVLGELRPGGEELLHEQR
jgi:hypothetical protein